MKFLIYGHRNHPRFRIIDGHRGTSQYMGDYVRGSYETWSFEKQCWRTPEFRHGLFPLADYRKIVEIIDG